MKSRTMHSALRIILKLAPAILLLVIVAIVAVVTPDVLRPSNIEGILIAAAPIAVLALGALVVLLSAGLDLSAGFGVAMVAVAASSSIQNGGSFDRAVLIATLFGVGLGLVNGLLIAVVHLEPFIATLATYVAVPGVTLLTAPSGEVVITNGAFLSLGSGDVLGIPTGIVVALGVAMIVGWLINRTPFGPHLYALGSSQGDSARLSGVSVNTHIIAVYVISGLLTACTALLLASQSVVVAPNIGGVNVLLDAYAATVIGGTSIYGARGSVTGTLFGAVIIALITNVIQVAGASAESLQLWNGVIIGLALALDAAIRRARRAVQARGEVSRQTDHAQAVGA